MPPKAAPSFSGPYFFADPAAISENNLTLSGADARHLGVRRARPGDMIHVGDGAGRLFEARIDSIEGEAVSASIVSTRQVPAPRPRITVLQGLAKGTKVDWVVEKLVELGVDRVVVFSSGRSIPKWDRAKSEAALKRWERVAGAAAKQSRRAWLPQVAGPFLCSEAVRLVAGASLALVADPGAEQGLRPALAGDPADEVLIVVGPEGGLAAGEVAEFVGAGATAIDLGSQILRTETAGLALASVVMYELGRFG